MSDFERVAASWRFAYLEQFGTALSWRRLALALATELRAQVVRNEALEASRDRLTDLLRRERGR